MKTAAIIAEYNPLHEGHAYQIRKVKELSGADHIIVLMSGDFVQRGIPACADKYVRTGFALDAGASMVVELPAAVSTGSAGDFAAGAAAILDGLGVVDELWFGSESGRIEELERYAAVLAVESDPFKAALRDALSSGQSYPVAQEEAVYAALRSMKNEATRGEIHEVLSGSNNMLGIAYMTALKKRGSKIVPRTLKREGSGYHGDPESVRGEFASAEWIRSRCEANQISGIRPYVPASVYDVLCDRDKCFAVSIDDFSDMLFFKLASMNSDDLREYAGMTEDLANRIRKLYRRQHRITEFAEALKTRNLTRSRIDRVLLHILLGIRDADTRAALQPEYVRILGFRNAKELFSEIGRRTRIMLAAGAADVPGEWYGNEVFAAELYEYMRSKKTNTKFCSEFNNMPIK